MAKYKILQEWRNKYTKELYKENDVIELTDERANEAINNLKAYDGEFLKKITDEPTEETEQAVEVEESGINAEEMTVPQLKQALDQLEIEYKSSDTKDVLLALLESAQVDTEKEGD